MKQLNNVRKSIETVAGTAWYQFSLTNEELDAVSAAMYSTKNGYWLIHRGKHHHVYKVI